jgi:hypothetical protein
MVGFVISALLLLAVAIGVARRLGRDLAEQFWIGVAATALQLGTISLVTSVLERLTPAGWLAVQGVLSLGVGVALRLLHSARQLHEAASVSERFTPLSHGRGSDEPRPALPAPWLTGLLVCALGAVFVISAILQLAKPVDDVDARLYHASRCLYWIQNGSLFPFETHNDRQTAFPFGAELFFLWPVLFTRSEALGRLVFGLALPLSTLGVVTLLRQLRLGRNGSLAGGVFYAVTPAVLTYALQLKPELWAALFTCGIGFWLLRGYRAPPRAFLGAGLFLALSVNVRFTTLALLPALAAMLWFIPACGQRLRALVGLGTGAAVGACLSGLLTLLVHNFAAHGHPLGGPQMRFLVRAEMSAQQLYTHAVRVPFFLFELPRLRSHALRERLERWGNECIARLGADAPLAGEACSSWPGDFTFRLPAFADRFSLGGMIWLAGLVIGSGLALAGLVRTFPGCRLRPLAALALLTLPLFLFVAFVVRWMSGMERFWIPAYALGLPVGLALLARPVGRWRVVQALALAGLGLLVVMPLRQKLTHLQHFRYVHPPWEWWFAEPYPDVQAQLPQGARILLLCDCNFLDYSLFGPHAGYPNRVIPWGQKPWDPGRAADLLKQHAITHVLVTSRDWLNFIEPRRVDAAAAITWFSQQPGMRELPLESKSMRLFAVAARP